MLTKMIGLMTHDRKELNKYIKIIIIKEYRKI